MKKRTRRRREVSREAAALTVVVQGLHKRIEELEKKATPKQPIGFRPLEGCIDGGGIHQDPED